MGMSDVFEACCRCRWWDAEEEHREDDFADYCDCFAHVLANGDWHQTKGDERCPRFKELHRDEGLQGDVCSGCQLTQINLRAIEDQVAALMRMSDLELTPRVVSECRGEVRKLANTIRFGVEK